MGSFRFLCSTKVGVLCISEPPNYVSKIWGQILGFYTRIYSIHFFVSFCKGECLFTLWPSLAYMAPLLQQMSVQTEMGHIS